MSVLRVLYLHPFSAFGGAAKSLCEMFRALPPGSVDGVVLVPPGAAARAMEAAGLKVISVRGIAQWDNTRFGHYRGIRWLILLRELCYWPFTMLAILELARHGPFDVVHANEITALLPAVLAKRRLKCPLVVHVRSLQCSSTQSIVSQWLTGLLRRQCEIVVAIDEAVRRTLPADLNVQVIHNGMAIPDELPARPPARRFCISIIGVLHPSKGVYALLEAVRILRDRAVPVRVLVVGENVRNIVGFAGWVLRKFDLARDVRRDLESYVSAHSLQSWVEFTGFVADVRSIYAQTDAVCFPSRLDAPGRPVFEAALFGLPSIVAMRNPTTDVVESGLTGLCIDEPTPLAIADAIETLACDPNRAQAMGRAARTMALGRFDSRMCARRILESYRRASRRLPSAVGAGQSS